MIHFSTEHMDMDTAFADLLQTLDVIGFDDVHGADNPRAWLHGLVYEWNNNGWYSTDERDEHYFGKFMPNLLLTGYEFPRRWNMLVRDYLPDDWSKMLRQLEKDKDAFYYSETGVWMKPHEERAEDNTERDGWHPRGNCMLSLSYSIRRYKEASSSRSMKRMVSTLISRTCYLLPLGPLDTSFAMVMTAEIAKALGIREFRVRWFLSQAQIQTWPAAVWWANGPLGRGELKAPGMDGTLRIETDAKSLAIWRDRELTRGANSETKQGAIVVEDEGLYVPQYFPTSAIEASTASVEHMDVLSSDVCTSESRGICEVATSDLVFRCPYGGCGHLGTGDCKCVTYSSEPHMDPPAETVPLANHNAAHSGHMGGDEPPEVPYRYFHGLWPKADPRSKFKTTPNPRTTSSGANFELHRAGIAQQEKLRQAWYRERVERVGSDSLPLPFTTELGTSYWLSNFITDTIKYRFHNPHYTVRKYRMCHRWSWAYNRVRESVERGEVWRAKDFVIPIASAYYTKAQEAEFAVDSEM